MFKLLISLLAVMLIVVGAMIAVIFNSFFIPFAGVPAFATGIIAAIAAIVIVLFLNHLTKNKMK